MSIGTFCTREVVIAERGTSIVELARLMRSHHVGDVVIIDKTGENVTPVGIVTDRDIIVELIAEEVELNSVTAGDIMSTELITATVKEGVWEALQLMRSSGLLEEMMPEFRDMFHQDGLSQGDAHCDDIWTHTLEAVSHAVSDAACLRWALLLHDIGKPRCRSRGDGGKVHFYGHEKCGSEIAGVIAERFRFSRKESFTE